MVSQDVPESDWKVFRELREGALQRFCDRTLSRVEEFCQDESRSAHDRYLAVYRYLRERDEELAYAFDDPKRSQMVPQLAALHALDLVEPEEFARFTEATREKVELLSGGASGT